ncbi:MAG: cytochrome P450 [Chloroflexota bacterium]|nr:cytochrome P450 [Chloroflexota bacterium]
MIGTAAPELIEVTRFAEVAEALRHPKLAVTLDERSVPVRGGTVLRIDGEAHTKRRRLFNRLVFRGGHQRLRADVLRPAIDRELAAARARASADGRGRLDVVAFCYRVLTELVATMIGLDRAQMRTDIEELFRLQADLDAFPRFKTQLLGAAPLDTDGEARVEEALARLRVAKDAFSDRWVRPALAARRELMRRHQAGEIGDDEMPSDLLTMVAAHADPAFEADPDLPVRHAVIDFLHAGTGTSVGAVAHTANELERWWRDHPVDRERRTDAAFLSAAVYETLRLHAANPAEIRRATEDVTLSAGTRIPAGRFAALRTGMAHRDRDAWGPNAEAFDPRRVPPPGTAGYGLAFGAGAHMCYGLPLAVGDDGVDGNIVLLLRSLYEAGMEHDPDDAPVYRPGVAHADLRNFERYPVLIRATA